jgi:hypothetical protein
MSLKDDLETIEPAYEVQKAFDGSIGLNGRYPWTARRQTAAMHMGCEIMEVVGARSDLRKLTKQGTYPNAMRDVVIVLWLCSLHPEEVIDVICTEKTGSVGLAFNWAEAEGISYGSEKYREGLTLVTSIIGEILSSSATSEKKDINPDSKKNINQHGKSVSPSPPRKPAEKRQAT